MVKFNTVLNGRPSAKEAASRIQQIVNGSADDVVLDFAGVEVLTPSYADELLRVLKDKYGADKVKVINTAPSALETLNAVNAISKKSV